MRTPPFYLALAIATTLPLMSTAQEASLSKQFEACMDKSGGVTQGMVECMVAETKRHDARLNKAYKALMGSLNPERQKQLQEAQRAWLKFRDTNCAFYYDPDGGTLARVEANDCVMNMTANRAKELEALAK
jgi:uncharacterized protein YecT (DUF1311 family)